MNPDEADARPLAVVEIGDEPSAAFAARLLGNLGATVTKLTPPSARCDDFTEALDAGKRCEALDGTAAGQARLAALIGAADVLLCAGDADSLDTPPLSLSSWRSRFPRLISAAITPFGESGSHRGYQGSDLIALHAGGFGYGIPPRVDDPDREHPLQIPGEQVSLLCGLVLCVGVLHALCERDRDGAGRHVELSAQEVVASLIFNNLAGHLAGDGSDSRLASDRPGGRRLLLPCADGNLTAMIGRPGHLRAWLEILGPVAAPLRERLAAGTAPAGLQAEIDALTVEWAAGRTRAEVTETAQARHAPVEPVLDAAELLQSPQLAARDFWRTREAAGLRIPGHPFGPTAAGDPPRELAARAPSMAAPAEAAADRGPFSGLRVVDFSRVFAAPIATRILAALGADVVRVESTRDPDQMRRRPFSFRVVNGDKRSLALDARKPADLEAIRTLLRDADVVVENFTTGTMERLGLGWETLHREYPRLIVLSVSGMGRTGPFAHHAMYGQLAHAYAGLTAILGYEGGPPRGTEDGGYWSDPITGYAAAAALLAAVREQARSRRGRRVDISLVEATASLAIAPVIAAQQDDAWGPRGNVCPTMAPHDLYRCRPLDEDRWLALSVRDDQEWRAFCAVIGRPDLAADRTLATLEGRQTRRDALRVAIEAWSRTQTPAEATRCAQAAGIPAAPSMTAADILSDPHLRERGVFLDDASAPGGVVMRSLPPWRLHPPSSVRYGPAPALGE